MANKPVFEAWSEIFWWWSLLLAIEFIQVYWAILPQNYANIAFRLKSNIVRSQAVSIFIRTRNLKLSPDGIDKLTINEIKVECVVAHRLII